MPVLFSVEDRYELLAIHRALFTAKFAPDSPAEFTGSPLLARACERIVAALQELDPGTPPDTWTYWQRPERHHKELALVRLRLSECREWASWALSEREQFIRDLLSPLCADESTTAELLAYGDAGLPPTAA